MLLHIKALYSWTEEIYLCRGSIILDGAAAKDDIPAEIQEEAKKIGLNF